jgi:hypothetical protein
VHLLHSHRRQFPSTSLRRGSLTVCAKESVD